MSRNDYVSIIVCNGNTTFIYRNTHIPTTCTGTYVVSSINTVCLAEHNYFERQFLYLRNKIKCPQLANYNLLVSMLHLLVGAFV